MSRRKSNPALLGLFVVGALALLFAAVVLLAGGSLLTRKQQVVMHFGGSIYGLQLGAPVVFRGVRLGSISAIGLSYDKVKQNVVIPVKAELDRDMLRSVSGGNKSEDPAEALPGMIERGLRAQLAMQSLLTGQLYVDLDFHPDKPGLRVISDESAAEIPTISTTFQELQSQVDELDLKRLVADIAAIASSTRALLASPELGQSMKDLAGTASSLRSLSDKLDRQALPVLKSAQSAADASQLAMRDIGRAASQVGDSAQRIGTAVQGAAGTFAPDAPLLKSLRNAADELALTAEALRKVSANEAPLSQNLQRTLQDVAKSARALRELAETLDQQPESVLKGRR